MDHQSAEKNVTRSGFTQMTLALLVAGLIVLHSFGDEASSKDSVPKPGPGPLGLGDHTRTLLMGEQKRTYLVHIPKGYDPKKPAAVVLALHGSSMNEHAIS
jgi:polyhydroxybutyrate depolymerase